MAAGETPILKRSSSASWSWVAFQVRSPSESFCSMKALASPVMRGGLPGSVPSAKLSKPRSFQWSGSRKILRYLGVNFSGRISASGVRNGRGLVPAFARLAKRFE